MFCRLQSSSRNAQPLCDTHRAGGAAYHEIALASTLVCLIYPQVSLSVFFPLSLHPLASLSPALLECRESRLDAPRATRAHRRQVDALGYAARVAAASEGDRASPMSARELATHTIIRVQTCPLRLAWDAHINRSHTQGWGGHVLGTTAGHSVWSTLWGSV